MTLDFRETPLADVAKFIQDFSDINVVLDLEGLDEAGVDPEEPVTLNLRDIPLKSSLKLLLGPLDLAYLIKNDVLLITSKDKADSLLETKVYPVADLVIPITNFNSGVGSNGQVGGQQGMGQQGAAGMGNQGAGMGMGSGFGASGNMGELVAAFPVPSPKDFVKSSIQATKTLPRMMKSIGGTVTSRIRRRARIPSEGRWLP